MIEGLYIRHLTPKRVDICGTQEGLEGLRQVVRDLIDLKSLLATSEAEDTGTSDFRVNLEAIRPGDYTALDLNLVDRDLREYSPFLKSCYGFPVRHRALLEQRVEKLAPPMALELVQVKCDKAEHACGWQSWMLSCAYNEDDSDDGSREVPSVNGALSCERCGRAVSSQDHLTFHLSPECDDLWLQYRPHENEDEEPWHYRKDPMSLADMGNGPPFLVASVRETGTMTVLGDVAAYRELEQELTRFIDSDEEYDHGHYPLYTNSPSQLYEIVLVLDEEFATINKRAEARDELNANTEPDCVSLDYTVCAIESDSCGWQGWSLDATYKFAEKTNKYFDFEIGKFLTLGDDRFCPKCGRTLVSLGHGNWYES